MTRPGPRMALSWSLTAMPPTVRYLLSALAILAISLAHYAARHRGRGY